MEYIEILGGRPLEGEVKIQGSKNAALPVLAAAVLHKGTTVLNNCPKITDVMYMIQILEEMGCHTSWSGHSLHIDTKGLCAPFVSCDLGEKMRSSVILMGALLGRMKEAWIPYPGGCTIGPRPIDMHINAFTRMGAYIKEENCILHAQTSGLCGACIVFNSPSVGATENVILGAVLASAETRIIGAAKEPEIEELCRFLNEKGARITGAGSSYIVIKGVSELHDSEYTLMPDRIVAGTYLMGALATRGICCLKDVPIEQLEEVFRVVKQMGAMVYLEKCDIIIDGRQAIHPVAYLETEPHPGFPTDLQSQLMAVLCLAKGESRIRETIFEDRFKIYSDLNRMGARVTVDKREAGITGVAALRGAQVAAPELRGGAALVIAGLAAEGRSAVQKYEYIKRGYEDICADFRQLGADITLNVSGQ